MINTLKGRKFDIQDDDGKNQQNVKNYNVINDFFSSVNEKLAFAKTEIHSGIELILNSNAKINNLSPEQILDDIFKNVKQPDIAN